jgi:hypothetical protein
MHPPAGVKLIFHREFTTLCLNLHVSPALVKMLTAQPRKAAQGWPFCFIFLQAFALASTKMHLIAYQSMGMTQTELI